LCEQLREDLNTCSDGFDSEYYRIVAIQEYDDTDSYAKEAIPVVSQPSIDPNSLSIWQKGQIRLFISHRDSNKREAKALAGVLSEYGVSSFVAHDTIEPMTTWQNEILKGLKTMEVMLAFITDSFHDSVWTNQEIGYALGRNIPIISLKMAGADPNGFISNVQAIKGRPDDANHNAEAICKVLVEKLGNKARLQTAIVDAFVQSPDFKETKLRFCRMQSFVSNLSESELNHIITEFKQNYPLYSAMYLTNGYNRLKKFLSSSTGRAFNINGRIIKPIATDTDEETPF
jgi:hypothetical protein